MEARDFTGRTVEEALTTATVELGVTSDRLDYEVIEKGSTGFLGLGSKNAVIRVRIKEEEPQSWASLEQQAAERAAAETVEEKISATESTASEAEKEEPQSWASVEQQAAERASMETAQEAGGRDAKRDESPVDEAEVRRCAESFLSSVFEAMGIEVKLELEYDDEDRSLSINMSGPEMGIIIGKRGQTLDSLQYLTNLAINRRLDSYVRVKMDTEDYRKRRKATLENLARNVAYKVKRTRRSVSLEPMNPYERRVIHYALQHDSYVTTYSEGEEPFRHVVVALK